jgi:hypothetical protein
VRAGANRLGLVVSVVLHAGAAVLLLPWAGRGRGPVQAPPIEVELIQASTAGAAAPPADAPARQPAPSVQPAPTAPPAADLAAHPAPPLQALQPEAASAASAPAAPQNAPPAPAAATETNLGNGGQDLADLDSRSDDIIPPRPDSRFRNLPPAYPAAG